MTQTVDFLTICQLGMTLRTRGRTEARIHKVDAEAGVIHGEIPMYGPISWRRDGTYKDSPGRAAGPFDLVPPGATPNATPKQSVKLGETLDPEGRTFCCD